MASDVPPDDGLPDAGAVVPYREPRGSRSPNLTTSPHDWWCNLPVKDDADRVRVGRMLSKADKAIGDVIGVEFALVGVLAHPVSIEDAVTGEVTPCLRTVLVDDQGVTYAAVSEGMAQSLARLCSLWGAGPWEPPLRVRVRQVATRLGRRTFELEVLGRAPVAPKQKGK